MEKQVLLEQARSTKSLPGVYLMKDSTGTVLYVGKAKNLKNRLITYFQPLVHEYPRIEVLVSRINHFEIILTETEAEALILESTLIKKLKPKFNIRLKDDKSYPYLKIQLNHPFPQLELTRKLMKDQARYFGPFPSAWAARQVLQLLNETFKLRNCSDNTFYHRSRPCILYQINRCVAPCVKLISPSDYRATIDQVVTILEGHTDSLIQTLRQSMEDAADQEEYELACTYRDQIRNLELITQTQGVYEVGSQRNRDVLGIARKNADAHGTLLKIRGGKLVAVQHYDLQNTDPSLIPAEIFGDFIAQYYTSLRLEEEKAQNSPDNYSLYEKFPSEVLVPEPPQELEWLERTLGISVRTAESSVDEQLLNVARSNAEYALEQTKKSAQGHGLKALEEIQESLHLAKLPQRIECFDISNIQGQDAVASRVVFMDGAPDKNLYRRYEIRTVEGQNDFAMMKEVLNRRFSNVEEELPDLVVVDGGKGQLSQATAILEELAVQGVGVVGLAKARTDSDFQAKEVTSSLERIFIPNRKNPVPLYAHTGAYKLLTHIRDEAHRFAITYHRLLRNKRGIRK